MNITYTMVGLKSDFDWLDLIFYFFIVSVDIYASFLFWWLYWIVYIRESMEVIRSLSLIMPYPPLSIYKQKSSTYSSS